jgi:hypothetical protein
MVPFTIWHLSRNAERTRFANSQRPRGHGELGQERPGKDDSGRRIAVFVASGQPPIKSPAPGMSGAGCGLSNTQWASPRLNKVGRSSRSQKRTHGPSPRSILKGCQTLFNRFRTLFLTVRPVSWRSRQLSLNRSETAFTNSLTPMRQREKTGNETRSATSP